MLIKIFQNAPIWVWGLLAALIALGLSQRRDRSLTLSRATIVPVAMMGLSFFGVSSVFGLQPLALFAWAKGLALGTAFALGTGLWKGIAWSTSTQRLHVPGSWTPLVLILAIFVAKFAVGAGLAMQPALRGELLFTAVVGLAYGSLSGMFFGRGIAMWRVAREHSARLSTSVRGVGAGPA